MLKGAQQVLFGEFQENIAPGVVAKSELSVGAKFGARLFLRLSVVSVPGGAVTGAMFSGYCTQLEEEDLSRRREEDEQRYLFQRSIARPFHLSRPSIPS